MIGYDLVFSLFVKNKIDTLKDWLMQLSRLNKESI